MAHSSALPAVVAILALSLPASADVVHLSTGGRLEGEVADLGDRLVVTLRSGKTEVDKAKVLRVEKKPVPWIEYARRRETLEWEEAGGGVSPATRRWQLARWCLEAGLRAEAIEELRAAAARDPDHEATRASLQELGLIEHQGRWLTADEKKVADGFVLHEGRWIPFEDYIARKEERQAREELRRHHLRARDLIKAWRDPGKREEAAREFAGIPPFARVRPLGDHLRDRDRDVRRFVLEQLREIKDLGMGPYFFVASLEDPAEEHRVLARSVLKELGPDEYLREYIYVLRNDGGLGRAHAAEALGEFQAGPAVAHLVHTLYTVTLEIRAQKGTVGRPIDGVAVDTVGAGTVTVETPRLGMVGIGTTVHVPAGDSLEPARLAAARALGRITGEEWGTDARAWVDWWKTEGKARYGK